MFGLNFRKLIIGQVSLRENGENNGNFIIFFNKLALVLISLVVKLREILGLSGNTVKAHV